MTVAPEVEAKIKESTERIAEPYLQAMFSTEPANREVAEIAVSSLYRLARLPVPRCVFWVDTKTQAKEAAGILGSIHESHPFGLSGVRSLLQATENYRTRLSMGEQLSPVMQMLSDAGVWRYAHSNVLSMLKSRTTTKMFDSEEYTAWRGPLTQAKDTIYGVLVEHSLNGARLNNTTLAHYGQESYHSDDMSMAGLALKIAIREVLSESVKPLDGITNERAIFEALKSLLFSVSGFYPYEGLVIFIERPSTLKWNLAGQLHCEDGPARAYRNGTKEYRLDGVTIPELLITDPSKLEIDTIAGERNAEVRRVMLERYGYERFLTATASFVRSDMPEYGKLWECSRLQDDRGYHRGRWGSRWIEPFCFLELLNKTPEPDGTRKKYFHRVPPRYKTAKGAYAWIHRLNVRDLNKLVAGS